MVALCFFGSFLFYTLAASLPFWNLPAKVQYPLAMSIGLLTSALWTTIARNVAKNSIVVYGAYYDVMLTSVFLAVPLLFTGFTLTTNQTYGILIMILGVVVTKL